MLTIAAIVAIVAVVNAVLPSVSRTSGALISASGSVEDRIASQISVVHATGQTGSPNADVWVKNTGAATIEPISRVDVFFGPEGNFQRIAYDPSSSCTAPCWYGSIENASTWEPTATLRVTIKMTADLTSGTTYYVKVVTPNGIADSKFFTV